MHGVPAARNSARVLGAPIDALSWSQALERIGGWAAARESRYVCICNVHSVVSASGDADFARAIEECDLATPDGAPVAWMLRRLGYPAQQRINGPDLMWKYLGGLDKNSPPIYLYGGTEETLAALQIRIGQVFPEVSVAGSHSPPFRELTPEEDAAAVERINASGAGTVWVSLGCPKQERWMAAHRGRINAVMIGVGAAFDFHAGTVQRAPEWMRNHGLEWLHRLAMEPGRLWKRYLVTNSVFMARAAAQLLRRR